MRRKLIAANWKMHGTSAMAQNYVADLHKKLSGLSSKPLEFDVLLCPAMPYLSVVAQAVDLSGAAISVGAQTVSEHEQGAFTGESSTAMLADLGVGFALVGHSERRELFGESNQIVADKFVACNQYMGGGKVKPVLCLGETLAQRQAGLTEQIIAEQLACVIEAAGIDSFAHAVIAYEPVWAIGTGETATPDQAQSVHRFVRAEVAKKSTSIAESIQILYGGSVKPSNAAELFAQADIDGGLVGGASLEAASFAEICKAAA